MLSRLVHSDDSINLIVGKLLRPSGEWGQDTGIRSSYLRIHLSCTYKLLPIQQKLWSENRYLYISQVASAWIVMAPPPPGMRPHRLAPPRRLSAHATAEEGDRIDVEPSPP